MTAVQWIEKILEGQKDKPFDYLEWKIVIQHALELEKDQIMDAISSCTHGVSSHCQDFDEWFENLKKDNT